MWIERNNRVFKDKSITEKEVSDTLKAHIQETLKLTRWKDQDLTTNSNEMQILQDWGLRTISVYTGGRRVCFSIGTSTNNVIELEGMLLDMDWAIKQRWLPLILEGDSLLIINMARRLQAGSIVSKISKNCYLECKLKALNDILDGHPAVVFQHVNKLMYSITNKGVLSSTTFLTHN